MAIKEIKTIIIILMILTSINFVKAETLSINVENNYIPGETVEFSIDLYKESGEKIPGQIQYQVLNYYTETIKQGKVMSGEKQEFTIPTNAYQGPWKIIAKHNEVETNQLFNVGELEKAEINLQGDMLIIKNTGNTPYEKKILIYIGENDQTASIYLDVGQTKKIRLTAPQGTYDVKVLEGNNKEAIEFKGVSLTGNVIGLERETKQGIFAKYSIVWLFLSTIIVAFFIGLGLRMHKKISKRK